MALKSPWGALKCDSKEAKGRAPPLPLTLRPMGLCWHLIPTPRLCLSPATLGEQHQHLVPCSRSSPAGEVHSWADSLQRLCCSACPETPKPSSICGAPRLVTESGSPFPSPS